MSPLPKSEDALATPLHIAIIGAGAWGSALATLAAANGHHVSLWSRRSSLDLGAIVEPTDLIVSAVSMQGVRAVLEQLQGVSVPDRAILVTATKGLLASEARALPLLPSQLWQDTFPTHPVVVLSGPNLSQEIQQGMPAATVVSSTNAVAAGVVQTAFSSKNFRVYTNPDPLGVELGGTLKNIMAIAVGACDGLDLGTNAKAALMTRGLLEIIRIGTHWGAKAETFYGLSGLGDLLATCNSSLSRNYQVGYRLAQGESLPEILRHLTGTAEGINTSRVLVQIAFQQEISIPISELVDRLLQGKITPQSAVAALMLRDAKPESHDLGSQTK